MFVAEFGALELVVLPVIEYMTAPVRIHRGGSRSKVLPDTDDCPSCLDCDKIIGWTPITRFDLM